jgi:hypothetical protein
MNLLIIYFSLCLSYFIFDDETPLQNRFLNQFNVQLLVSVFKDQ